MAYQKTNWVNDETPLNADNMNNIENGIEQNESDIASLDNAKAPIVLTGTTDPTTSTIGVENQLYRNTTTNALFICTNAVPGNYIWQSVGGVSQTDFDNLVNNITQIQARDDNSFKIGGASVVNSSTVAIGKNAYGSASLSVVIGRDTEVTGSQQVAIGYKAKTGFYAGSIAIGSNAQLGHSVSGIQLGSGTNNTTQTLQIHNDNIYNYNNHTLTVQNIELNGTDINTVIDNKIDSAITTALNTAV